MNWISISKKYDTIFNELINDVSFSSIQFDIAN
jgi:hypothetical protein